MNIQLAGTEEFIDGESKGALGQVLIRYVWLPTIARLGWKFLNEANRFDQV